jgi:hypothetical protein
MQETASCCLHSYAEIEAGVLPPCPSSQYIYTRKGQAILDSWKSKLLNHTQSKSVDNTHHRKSVMLATVIALVCALRASKERVCVLYAVFLDINIFLCY